MSPDRGHLYLVEGQSMKGTGNSPHIIAEALPSLESFLIFAGIPMDVLSGNTEQGF